MQIRELQMNTGASGFLTSPAGRTGTSELRRRPVRGRRFACTKLGRGGTTHRKPRAAVRRGPGEPAPLRRPVRPQVLPGGRPPGLQRTLPPAPEL